MRQLKGLHTNMMVGALVLELQLTLPINAHVEKAKYSMKKKILQDLERVQHIVTALNVILNMILFVTQHTKNNIEK